MVYQRAMGWSILLVLLVAASTVVVRAEDAADEETLHDWTVTKIKEITDSASSTASGTFENSKMRVEAISNSAKEYTDQAKNSLTRATSGKEEPDSKAHELLEKLKKAAFDNYQAAKEGCAESAEAAKKQYDTVTGKLSELTQQVKDKIVSKPC